MIEVREVEAGDVRAVTALVAEVLGEFGLQFGKGSPTDAELHDLPASYVGRGGAFWVALRDGELLGTCGVFPVAPQTFELRKMYLRGASRGLGIGKRLLGAAIDWVRAQGGTRIALDTIDEMKQAIAFYEAHGFVRDDAQKRAARCTRGYLLVLD
jgi:GNAT superfamily N-acetyltransferase